MGMEIKDKAWGKSSERRAPVRGFSGSPFLPWLEWVMLRDVMFRLTDESTESGVLERLRH